MSPKIPGEPYLEFLKILQPRSPESTFSVLSMTANILKRSYKFFKISEFHFIDRAHNRETSVSSIIKLRIKISFVIGKDWKRVAFLIHYAFTLFPQYRWHLCRDVVVLIIIFFKLKSIPLSLFIIARRVPILLKQLLFNLRVSSHL